VNPVNLSIRRLCLPLALSAINRNAVLQRNSREVVIDGISDKSTGPSAFGLAVFRISGTSFPV
jgi:hypothetical protein